MNLFLRILRRFFILKWEEIIASITFLWQTTLATWCFFSVFFGVPVVALIIISSLNKVGETIAIAILTLIFMSTILSIPIITLKRWLCNNWKKAIEIETKK